MPRLCSNSIEKIIDNVDNVLAKVKSVHDVAIMRLIH